MYILLSNYLYIKDLFYASDALADFFDATARNSSRFFGSYKDVLQ
jgi:hypothetical protein